MKKITLLVSVFSVLGLSNAQVLTTNSGAPVGDNQNSKTAGKNGPVLLEDIHLIEKLASFDRERIPERVVHARGAGAYGEFITSKGFSEITKADFLSVSGKKTPVFVRFSTVVHQQGSPESYRDPRGFAVKFYTQEGNYELVGNNLPVFFIRDAMKFPDMVHAFKPSPVTNGASDPNRVFDFLSNIPESTHMLTWLYSDYGIPANYREMQGNGVHAYKWINSKNEVTYVKYKWIPKQGERNLTKEQAQIIQAKSTEHATMDLFQAIELGNYPQWDLYVQMLNQEDFNNMNINPLDPTKTWPEVISRPILVGTMRLFKNPSNYFEEVEQAAFAPGSLIPGIEPSEDKLLQGRLFSYFDTQRHRLGGNFQQLPINVPISKVVTYNQNGNLSMRKQSGEVNYQPSTSKAEVIDNDQFKYSRNEFSSETAVTQSKIDKPNDFTQAGDTYRSFSQKDKDHLITNLGDDLKAVKNKKITARMISYFYQADRDYGIRLAKYVGMDRKELESYLTQ